MVLHVIYFLHFSALPEAAALLRYCVLWIMGSVDGRQLYSVM